MNGIPARFSQMRSRFFVAVCTLLLVVGCDNGAERITRLEKENQELKAEVNKHNTALEYDLQAKCSKDAKQWFVENWGRPDKDTVLLTQTNHYNKDRNKCFVVVEYHYYFGKNGSWTNHLELWDVYENSQYGDVSEMHRVELTPEYKVGENLIRCEVYGKKCSTLAEFNTAVRPFMSN